MINYIVTPRYKGLYDCKERLNDCLWKLEHNNPERIKTKPQWKQDPLYFVYNTNYTDREEYQTQVIFSVGYLGEEYIKHFNIDILKNPYWCGKVFFNELTEELSIKAVKPWEYQNEIEGDKKKGWIVKSDLRDLFRVEVDLWNDDD